MTSDRRRGTVRRKLKAPDTLVEKARAARGESFYGIDLTVQAPVIDVTPDGVLPPRRARRDVIIDNLWGRDRGDDGKPLIDTEATEKTPDTRALARKP